MSFALSRSDIPNPCLEWSCHVLPKIVMVSTSVSRSASKLGSFSIFANFLAVEPNAHISA